MERQHFNEVPETTATEKTKRQLGDLATKIAEDDTFFLPDLSGMSLADLHRLDIDPEVRERVLNLATSEDEIITKWRPAM